MNSIGKHVKITKGQDGVPKLAFDIQFDGETHGSLGFAACADVMVGIKVTFNSDLDSAQPPVCLSQSATPSMQILTLGKQSTTFWFFGTRQSLV